MKRVGVKEINLRCLHTVILLCLQTSRNYLNRDTVANKSDVKTAASTIG